MKSVNFLQKEQISENAWTFYFSRPENFTFRAGQYISLILPKIQEKNLSHFFTISSAPTQKDFFTITVVKSASEFKQALFNLPNNTEVNYLGPTGAFVLKDDDLSPHVFIAGGIGITPFISFIEDMVARSIKRPVKLLASFSTYDVVSFYPRLVELIQDHKNIEVLFTITRPDESKTVWRGHKHTTTTGRINKQMITDFVGNLQEPTYMIVGSPTMVLDMEELLLDMGIQLEKIREEQFTGY